MARALEDVDVDRLDERAALIAHHYEEGGELLEAAQWNARSGTWAGCSQPLEAARRWRRVSTLTRDLEPTPETLTLAMNAPLQLLLLLVRLGAASEEEARRYEDEAAEVFADSSPTALGSRSFKRWPSPVTERCASSPTPSKRAPS